MNIPFLKKKYLRKNTENEAYYTNKIKCLLFIHECTNKKLLKEKFRIAVFM